MKTLSVKDLSRAGASRAIREAEREPVLISRNNAPAVWMIGAGTLAQAAAASGDKPNVYRSAVQVLAVKLYDGGVLSIGRAAELAELSLADFMDLCGELYVPVYRAPQQGLEAEVDAFEVWASSVAGAERSSD